MRPDIPWNVAGIPSEAREAARAAARREGLSVGEWMTRRILRSFSDAADDMTPAREQWSSNGSAYAAEPRQVGSRRDTEDMLARVAKSETESTDIYRRIEEQLRQVARRLENAERNQSENNRAMNKAATEINVAAREQAQAFDQLGGSVVGLADRLDRVERASANDGAREAIKGLHQGLSRLADQISNTANLSATQIGALATNLEALAGRLAQARQDSDQVARSIEVRVSNIDDHVSDIDQRVGGIDHKVAQIDQRMTYVAAIDERLKAVERAAQASNEVLAHAVESLESRKGDDAAVLRRDAETHTAISRLEDEVVQLQARGSDPTIDRRLTGIERSLADIVGRFEQPTHGDAIEDNVKRLAQRIEAAEIRQREQTAELKAAMAAGARASVFEPAPPPPAAPPSPFAPVQSFDPPPFPDADPFQTSADPFATAPSFEAAAAPFAAEAAFGHEAFPADVFAAPPPPPPMAESESYLSAARRSARAAAAQTDAERVGRASGFSWSAAPAAPAPTAGSSKKTYIWIALIALLAIVAIAAGAVLSQKLSTNSTRSVSLLFPKAPVSAPVAPQAVAPETAAPAVAEPQASEMKPLEQHTVKSAPVHAVAANPPAVPAPAKPAQAALTPLDKLTQLANAGNAKAELVVGLKYLDGDGVPVSEADAAKWLERAAEQGQPVAQYRLGTIYERGRGVPADAAKAIHWYQVAAQAGNRKAMHNLAVAYASGSGTTKNLAEAARWFAKAASLGLSDSQFNLAVLYERGMGVPQSLLDAYKWYAIAAANGDGESKTRMDALATQISADDKAAAQHAADAFHPQAIDPKSNVAPQMSDVAF